MFANVCDFDFKSPMFFVLTSKTWLRRDRKPDALSAISAPIWGTPKNIHPWTGNM